MPRIPRQGEQNIPAATQQAPQLDPNALSQTTQAIGQAAEAVFQLDQDWQRRAAQIRERQETAAASQATARFRVESAAKLQELSRQDNPYGIGEQYQEWARQRQQEYLEGLESEGTRLKFSRRFDDIAATGAINAIQTEAARTVETNIQQLNESVETTANAVYSQPGAFEQYLDQTLEDLDAMGSVFSPEGRQAKKEEIENTYAMSALQSRVELGDPRSVLNELTDGQWDQYLTGSNKARMVAAANRAVQMEKKRREARDKAMGEEVEDILDTAMNDLQDGYPPRTPMEEVRGMLEDYQGEDRQQLVRRTQVLETYGDRLQQFALMPASQRQSEINEMRARRQRQEASDEEIELLGLYESQNQRIQSQVRDDAISTAVRVGLITDHQPIDMREPNTSALANRERQAQVIRKQYGEQALPLTETEYGELVQRVKQNPGNAGELIGTLKGAWSSRTMRTVASKLQEDSPAMAMAFMRAHEQPELSGMIAEGQEIINQTDELKFPDAEISTAINRTYGNVFQGNPQARRAAVDAAKAVYAYRLGGKVPAAAAFNSNAYKEALKLVMGGELRQNGEVYGGPFTYENQMVIPPVPGMDATGFEDLVESLTPEDMTQYGRVYSKDSGVFFPAEQLPTYADGTEVDVSNFKDYAAFVPVGDGRYRVEMPGGSLMVRGEPYYIDLRAKVQAQPTGKVEVGEPRVDRSVAPRISGGAL